MNEEEENDFVDEIRRLRNQIYGGSTNSGDVVKEEVRQVSPSSEEERTRLRNYRDVAEEKVEEVEEEEN